MRYAVFYHVIIIISISISTIINIISVLLEICTQMLFCPCVGPL